MTVLAENTTNNFELGIAGFTFADLFDAVKLKELAETFYAEVGQQDEILIIEGVRNLKAVPFS